MQVLSLEETDLSLCAVAELAKQGTVILTRKGKPFAAIKDLSGFDWESVSLANNPRFLDLIEESRRSYREHGGISLEELRQDLGLKPPRRPAKRKKAH